MVLENQLGHNSMTEKLFDSYLGNSYPIYAGATNTEDYFPENSFTKLTQMILTALLMLLKNVFQIIITKKIMTNYYCKKCCFRKI